MNLGCRPWPNIDRYNRYWRDSRFQDCCEVFSWNLGYRSPVRYNLYRFVPGEAAVSKIHEKTFGIYFTIWLRDPDLEISI